MPETYGIKMSKPGVDVSTAAEKDLVASSASLTQEIKTSIPMGTDTLTSGGVLGLTYNHNLGAPPYFQALYDLNDNNWRKANEYAESLTGLPYVRCHVTTDNNTFYITVINFEVPAYTFRYKIIILR